MIAKNNLFNIRFNPENKWFGQCGFEKGFCKFRFPEYSVRAVTILICKTYALRGWNTIRTIVSHFAPNIENDTELYIKFVSRTTGLHPDAKLDTPYCYGSVIQAMAAIKTGIVYVYINDVKYSVDYLVQRYINKLKLTKYFVN